MKKQLDLTGGVCGASDSGNHFIPTFLFHIHNYRSFITSYSTLILFCIFLGTNFILLIYLNGDAMDLNHLTEEEISYELLLRGHKVAGDLEDMRSVLHGMILSEEEGHALATGVHQVALEREPTNCRIKIRDLAGEFAQVSCFSSDSYQRFRSRYLHLSNRIQRLSDPVRSQLLIALATVRSEASKINHRASGPTIDLISFIDDDNHTPLTPPPVLSPGCVSTFVDSGFLSRLDKILTFTTPSEPSVRPQRVENSYPVTSTQFFREPFSAPANFANEYDQLSRPPVLASQPQVSSVPYFRPAAPLVPLISSDPTEYPQSSGVAALIPSSKDDHSVSFSNSNSVARWNLKFDGTSGLNEFLIQVEEKAMSRGLSDDSLFAQATDLFSGDALLWYRMKRRTLRSWLDVVRELKASFLPSDYDNKLWGEIRARTQAPSERVEIYIAIMENLFARLAVCPDESQRVSIIRSNLKPYILERLIAFSISTIDELIRTCRGIEEVQVAISAYREPPQRCNTTLEPDLAFSRPVSHRSVPHYGPRSNQAAVIVASPLRPTTRCWNCKELNHSWRNCSKPLVIFCYGCGQPGVTAATCSRCCSKSQKNSQAGCVPTADAPLAH